MAAQLAGELKMVTYVICLLKRVYYLHKKRNTEEAGNMVIIQELLLPVIQP